MKKKGLSNEELMILHRHWMWANICRISFDKELLKIKNQDQTLDINPTRFFADRVGAFMCMWYGLLYSVLEEILNRKLSIQGLECSGEIINELRLFRNAVFHPQKKYWTDKIFKLIEKNDSATRIREIHSALGSFLYEEINNREERKEE